MYIKKSFVWVSCSDFFKIPNGILLTSRIRTMKSEDFNINYVQPTESKNGTQNYTLNFC